jgi:hypothetical protein
MTSRTRESKSLRRLSFPIYGRCRMCMVEISLRTAKNQKEQSRFRLNREQPESEDVPKHLGTNRYYFFWLTWPLSDFPIISCNEHQAWKLNR